MQKLWRKFVEELDVVYYVHSCPAIARTFEHSPWAEQEEGQIYQALKA